MAISSQIRCVPLSYLRKTTPSASDKRGWGTVGSVGIMHRHTGHRGTKYESNARDATASECEVGAGVNTHLASLSEPAGKNGPRGSCAGCGCRDRRGRSHMVSEPDSRLAVVPAAEDRFIGPKRSRPEARLRRHVSGAGHRSRVLLEFELEIVGMRCGCEPETHFQRA